MSRCWESLESACTQPNPSCSAHGFPLLRCLDCLSRMSPEGLLLTSPLPPGPSPSPWGSQRLQVLRLRITEHELKCDMLLLIASGWDFHKALSAAGSVHHSAPDGGLAFDGYMTIELLAEMASRQRPPKAPGRWVGSLTGERGAHRRALYLGSWITSPHEPRLHDLDFATPG